jgi:hypothetical protein
MEAEIARDIAHTVHLDQRTRSGGLVVDHLDRVAAAVPQEAQSVALLHDVLEWTDVPESDLKARGLTPLELRALRLLTRDPEESFELHALEIAYAQGPEGRLARIVKLADIDDHLANDPEHLNTRPYGWARRHIVGSLELASGAAPPVFHTAA